jgi:L-alanine-DL-glutamate epimerase-like enolase superfamily enzyme
LNVKFAEGSYGTFLLADDISTTPSRFGYAGRIKKPLGPGLGVTIDPKKLRRYQTASLAVHKF